MSECEGCRASPFSGDNPPHTCKPDPRDARITELERELVNTQKRLGERVLECDHLQAEVERLKERISTPNFQSRLHLRQQLATARRALENIASGGFWCLANVTSFAREALAALDRNISSHDVTAAIDHSINQGSIETGANPVQSDPECAALLRVAEAAEAALAGHGPFLTPYESRIVNALADLAEVRKVRKGGRDG